MEDRPGSLLDALRPAIKTGWRALLREVPAVPPGSANLVNSGMLVLMVDHTLDRLAARLREPAAADRERHDLSPFAGMSRDCHCGLNLLLGYYEAGARALRESVPEELGPARAEMMDRFNQLAHDEMLALCNVCHFRNGPQFNHRPGTGPPPA